MKRTRPSIALLAPVLLGYFVMAFCDMVPMLSGYLAGAYGEEQQTAISFLPTMVFLWFLLFSVPAASLMSRCGRKKMALAGYLMSSLGLLIPYLAGEGCSLGWYFVGFGMLGLGNMALQVPLNPMLASLAPTGEMSGYMTLGQIFRNAALMLFAPFLLGLTALFDSWRLLLPIYALVTLLAAVWLWRVKMPETRERVHRISIPDAVKLLGNRAVRLGVLGLGLFLMADVACGFLAARLVEDPSSLLTTTGYYAFRIAGSILGVWLLMRCSDLKYLRLNLLLALACVVALMAVEPSWLIYLLFGLIGFAFATTFATFYSAALRAAGDREDEAAGLLVMAISAGALSTPICGRIIAWTGDPHRALYFVVLCLLLMLWAASRIAKEEKMNTQNNSNETD